MRFEPSLISPGLKQGGMTAVRTILHPMKHSSRQKNRRWPLLLRFVKGAIHGMIVIPVFLHTAWAVGVVCVHLYTQKDISLPTSIIPSLSIVVGLMLVFRNQTSWNRFWDGRNNLTSVTTAVRNLARLFLTYNTVKNQCPTSAEQADIDRTVCLLVAIPLAIKNHLRAEWGAAFASAPSNDIEQRGDYNITPRLNPEYGDLLPVGFEGHEDKGLGLPLQMTFTIEAFAKRCFDRGWLCPPVAAQVSVQINDIVKAYGNMETIRVTPMPVGHLIHQKQVLALYCCIMPFAMVNEMGWWTILIVTLVTFTLYGIEGIGGQLEDPFGHDRNDIKMDAIVADTRLEIFTLLDEWKRTMQLWEQNHRKHEMFFHVKSPPPIGTAPTS